jgi:protein-tyrosine phosphatase
MVYWIGKIEQGMLGTMARPRGGDWLQDEARKLVNLEAHVVVSALTGEEETELDLENEPTFFQSAGLVFLSHPIGDRLTPNFDSKFKELIDTCFGHLQAGRNLVTHCRMGIGRASLLAASIMVKSGLSPEEAFKLISEKRGLAVPDTPEQIEWVRKHQGPLRAQ